MDFDEQVTYGNISILSITLEYPTHPTVLGLGLGLGLGIRVGLGLGYVCRVFTELFPILYVLFGFVNVCHA